MTSISKTFAGVLAFGAVIASFVGTTGASVLFVTHHIDEAVALAEMVFAGEVGAEVTNLQGPAASTNDLALAMADPP